MCCWSVVDLRGAQRTPPPPHRGNPGSATGYFTNQITKIKIVKNVLLLVYALGICTDIERVHNLKSMIKSVDVKRKLTLTI